MNSGSRISSIFLAALMLCLCALPAPAQGFLDTLKNIARDPVFTNYVRSKVTTLAPGLAPGSGYAQSGYSQSGGYASPAYPAYPAPGYNNSGFAASGFGSSGHANPSFASTFPAALAGSPSSASAAPAPVSSQPSSTGMTITKQLAPAELLQLSQYDIDVLVDESGSMSTRDCPDPLYGRTNISRWDWCRYQSSLLTQQTAGAMPKGIALVPFSDSFTRYENVSPQAINTLFSTSAPRGATNLSMALRAEFDRYFMAHRSGFSQRPLMISVITDGVPDNKGEVYSLIRNAAQQVGPNEIKVVFFLIGQDQKGHDFVEDLQQKLQRDGLDRTLTITQHPFAEVNQLGLARSLVYSMRSNG